MEQRTDEWFKSKIGKVGASKVHAVMAKGQGVTRKNYMTELLVARLTGIYPESYTSTEIQWGNDYEPMARSAYEVKTKNIVIEHGFIEHPIIKGFGASPDGLIGEYGGLEIKCPNTTTHLDTLLNKKINNAYILQMQTGMACTGRKWWDFVSFDPRLPEHLQIVIIRVDRDDSLIAKIETEVKAFLAELDAMMEKLKGESNVRQSVW